MTDIQKEQINRMRSEGMGYSKIATSLGLSENTVKSYCRRNSINSVPAVAKSEETSPAVESNVFCKNCGKSIEQCIGKKPRKFCSDKCRTQWWSSHTDQVTQKAIYRMECKGCGKQFDSYGNKSRKYCCHACYIKDRFGLGDTHDEGAV